jgi:hypothetical protein
MKTNAPPAMTLRISTAATAAVIVQASHSASPSELTRKSAIGQRREGPGRTGGTRVSPGGNRLREKSHEVCPIDRQSTSGTAPQAGKNRDVGYRASRFS